MNKELIEARSKEIDVKITEKSQLIQQHQQAMNQANADLNALFGSKYELQHWMGELAKSESSTIDLLPKQEHTIS